VRYAQSKDVCPLRRAKQGRGYGRYLMKIRFYSRSAKLSMELVLSY
jgi:hypothetical protein